MGGNQSLELLEELHFREMTLTSNNVLCMRLPLSLLLRPEGENTLICLWNSLKTYFLKGFIYLFLEGGEGKE